MFFSVSNTIESDSMIIDKTIDTTTAASPSVSKSPQTNLFPIFTNQKSLPSNFIW